MVFFLLILRRGILKNGFIELLVIIEFNVIHDDKNNILKKILIFGGPFFTSRPGPINVRNGHVPFLALPITENLS